MKIFLTLTGAVILCGLAVSGFVYFRHSDPAMDLVNEISERTATYNKFLDKISRDQAELNTWADRDEKKCEARGQLKHTKMTIQRIPQNGQLVCAEVPSAAQPAGK